MQQCLYLIERETPTIYNRIHRAGQRLLRIVKYSRLRPTKEKARLYSSREHGSQSFKSHGMNAKKMQKPIYLWQSLPVVKHGQR